MPPSIRPSRPCGGGPPITFLNRSPRPRLNWPFKKSIEMRALEQRVAALQEDLGRSNPEMEFSSTSPVMQRAINLARQAAPSEATILLRGESGTGKTVLARTIHSWSRRAAKPLGVISCPSFSAELLESELFGHVKGALPGPFGTTRAAWPLAREEPSF